MNFVESCSLDFDIKGTSNPIEMLSFTDMDDTVLRALSRYTRDYLMPYSGRLTHRHLDNMAADSQTIFSDALSWTKLFVF